MQLIFSHELKKNRKAEKFLKFLSKITLKIGGLYINKSNLKKKEYT